MSKGLNRFLITAAALGMIASLHTENDFHMSLNEQKYLERGMKVHKRTKPQKRKMKFKKKRR